MDELDAVTLVLDNDYGAYMQVTELAKAYEADPDGLGKAIKLLVLDGAYGVTLDVLATFINGVSSYELGRYYMEGE